MKQEAIIKILSSKSIAATRARVHILGFLLSNKKKATRLGDILNMPGEKFNRITIYRTLITLCEAGLIYKIIHPNNNPFYIVENYLNTHKAHTPTARNEYFHFKCESCGQVITVKHRFDEVKLPPGFTKTAINLFLTGKCPKCSGLG